MSKAWTDYEDETLYRLTYEHVAGTMDQSTRWRRISDDINGIHDRKRSARSCEARWQRIQQDAAR
jgi:hypothetical protein